MKPGWLVALLILGGTGPLLAQGLGDAASRERRKRQEAAPAPPRVFTDADLAKQKPPAADDGAAPAEAGEAAQEGKQAGARPDAKSGAPDPRIEELDREREERKLLEAEWRMRFANAREQLALAEAACWREVVRTEFYQGVPVQMKVKEWVETEELRQAKRALGDLEEEFRRTGLPPGWVR